MEIEKIDKNFLTERSIPENARIFDVRNDPFEINGVFFSGGHFVRMPEEDAKKVNPGVRELHACTGRRKGEIFDGLELSGGNRGLKFRVPDVARALCAFRRV